MFVISFLRTICTVSIFFIIFVNSNLATVSWFADRIQDNNFPVSSSELKRVQYSDDMLTAKLSYTLFR